jgi:F-type H+-transporting ATPase subunit alpha
LKQPQYSPVPVSKQVAIIYLGTKGLMKDVPVEKISQFEEAFLTTLEQRFPDVLKNFGSGKLESEDLATVETLAGEIAGQFK